MRPRLLLLLILLISCGPFFYQAPPPIAEYPERIETKRWMDLFTETSPRDPLLPDSKTVDESCRNLPGILKPMDTTARLAEIDRLIDINRAGDFSRLTANMLHEFRELAADPELFEAAGDYLNWRAEHPSVSAAPVPSQRPWHMDETEYAKAREIQQKDLSANRELFAHEISNASPALRPYWQVQEAAFEYRSGEYKIAERLFAAVVENHPNHPRAESAGLMRAVCPLRQAREIKSSNDGSANFFRGDEWAELLNKTETFLVEYMARYPAGRFSSDSCGWLGAVAQERDDLGLAVKYQLDRLDRQQTREVRRAVLRECDSIFEKLFDREEKEMSENEISPDHDFDAKSVARHPLIVRLFIQHALDPAAAEMLENNFDQNESSDRHTLEFLKKRTLKSQKWIGTALRELGAELLLHNGAADETTFTVLAWSASESGENMQALTLIDRIPKDTARDEVLHARAIILQRMGRHEEAVAAFDLLENRFPSSPLVTNLPQRRCISQFHSGQAGQALIGLLKPDTGSENPDAGLYPKHYYLQWADTILQFAPLDQLADAALELSEDQSSTKIVNDVICARALAMGDFPAARRYASIEKPQSSDEFDFPASQASSPADAGWEEKIAPLEQMTEMLNDPATSIDKSSLHLTIALHWWKYRGFITLPGLESLTYPNNESEKRELLRRQNGIQLGYGREAINRELDSRDEATHALAHALKAAKSPDPAIRRAALELANECLFRRAEFSQYQLSRALEKNDTALSADLAGQLDQLTKSKSAARYDFQPILGTWMPGNYSPSNSVNAIVAIFASGHSDQKWIEGEYDQPIKETSLLKETFSKIDPTTSLTEIRSSLADAKRRQNEVRKKMSPLTNLGIIDSVVWLDDLICAASLDDIGTQDFINYKDGHYDKLPASFVSFVDFQNKAQIQSTGNYEVGTIHGGINAWKEYLETYPDSPKAEAASLRLVRLTARLQRGRINVGAFNFPDAPIQGGYKHIRHEDVWLKPAPEKVLEMLVAHEKRFPAGRYQQDINLLKAECLIDECQLSPALDLLLEVLDDPLTSDLHPIAALDFCDISQRLLDTLQRNQVVTAFRENPKALPKLKLLVYGNTFLSRLKPMMAWLESEI